MTHPPIPPNCEWFFKETMQKGTFGFELGDNDWWPLTDDDFAKLEADEYPKGYWRKKIGAVARCAWLDCELDLANKDFIAWLCDQRVNHGCCRGFNDAFYWSDFIEITAEAWREWGRA